MSITTSTDSIETTIDTTHAPVVDLREDPADPRSQATAEAVPGAAPTRPTFTITEAATACSVSRKTITRKLPEFAGHGAAKDDDGVWRIPVEALLAVGLHPGRSLPSPITVGARPVAPPPAPMPPVAQDTVTIPRDRWDDVRLRLARAEAEAAERGLALADARLALRALTAGPLRAPEPQGPAPILAPHPQGPPTVPATGGGSAAPAGLAAGGAHGAGPALTTSVGLGGEVASGSTGLVAETLNPGPVAPDSTAPAEAVPADVVAARNLAARTGGYVPAGAPVRKRRWWRST
jgi:hypothetical protein